MPRFEATFTPQVWLGDQALEVDPHGDTTWDCTDEFKQLPIGYQAQLACEMSDSGVGHDIDDALKSDPAAPDWVRNWSGPFEIYIRQVPDPVATYRIEVRFDFTGTQHDAEAEAHRVAGLLGGEVTAIFDPDFEEV
jgi:hypothetical protein